MTEEEAKILHHRERTAFLDDLRYRQTRQGAFENSFLHLNHPLAGGGRLLEASDHGKSAALIRGNCEDVPRWRSLWNRARKRLTRKQKRILDALLVDFRTSTAAKIAHVERSAVLRFKKTFFKKHFAQCFQAWDCDFE